MAFHFHVGLGDGAKGVLFRLDGPALPLLLPALGGGWIAALDELVSDLG
jgi:hypothetical protein